MGRRGVSSTGWRPPLAHMGLCGCLLPTFSVSEQFRYKRRVYAQNLIDDKQFAKLHTKVKRLFLEGTPHEYCPHTGLAQPAFPEVGFRTSPGAGHRLHTHDWSIDRLWLNQILAGIGVRALLEAGGRGKAEGRKEVSIVLALRARN